MNNSFPILSDKILLYRAIAQNGWLDPNSGKLNKDAFILRNRINEKALSFALTPEDACKRLKKNYGVIQISVINMRKLGLNPIQDKKDHVSVYGFPNPDTNMQEALDLARQLVKFSKII